MFLNDVKVTIVRSNRKTLSLEVKNGEVIARAPLKMKEEEIYRFIEEKKAWIEKYVDAFNQKQYDVGDLQPFTKEELAALTEKARDIIPERVAYYAPKIGVTYNKITIRCQRTRWGSCSSSGNLSFNCVLALFPIEAIDSVVVHELCHRKHMNHSSKFYDEIEKVLPEYRQHNKWLNENGVIQLHRMPK